MSVTITIEDIRAYAEVDYIINHMNEKYQKMIPEKMLAFFHDFKDPNLNIKIDPYVPLQNQGLSRYALEIIALLHLKYWCENEERKQELYNIMLRNQEKLDEQMKNRFSVENLFEDNTTTTIESQEDFSKPKEINTVEQIEETVEEATEVAEEKEDNLPMQHDEESVGFIQKIIHFFTSIFGNKK